MQSQSREEAMAQKMMKLEREFFEFKANVSNYLLANDEDDGGFSSEIGQDLMCEERKEPKQNVHKHKNSISNNQQQQQYHHSNAHQQVVKQQQNHQQQIQAVRSINNKTSQNLNDKNKTWNGKLNNKDYLRNLVTNVKTLYQFLVHFSEVD